MDNEYPKAVYKAPGSQEIHGHMLSFVVAVDAADFAEAKANGWHETTPEAVEAYAAQREAEEQQRAAEANALALAAANANSTAAQPTRAELEVKAKELGITFNKNTTDAVLLKAINDKLAAG